VIYIGNVRLTPLSSREDPYRFENLTDALEFTRILRSWVWCCIGPEPDLFRVYPGGRIEDWTIWLGTPQAKARLARKKSEVPA
jgi:hypothetical protein